MRNGKAQYRRAFGRIAGRRLLTLAGSAAGLLLLAGCHQDMWQQPKVKPQEPSDFFTDGQASRPLVAHSVDQAHFWTDKERYTGYNGTKMTDKFPIMITRADLERGQERFNIYCSPCHGALGNGKGMISMRGLSLRRQPASYQTDRLRKMPVGHFYDVITNGYGLMYSYASRVEPDDRWRIAAYIRVLQRSQHAKPEDVPQDKLNQIGGATPSEPDVKSVPAGVSHTTLPSGMAPGKPATGDTEGRTVSPSPAQTPGLTPPSGTTTGSNNGR